MTSAEDDTHCPKCGKLLELPYQCNENKCPMKPVKSMEEQLQPLKDMIYNVCENLRQQDILDEACRAIRQAEAAARAEERGRCYRITKMYTGAVPAEIGRAIRARAEEKG